MANLVAHGADVADYDVYQPSADEVTAVDKMWGNRPLPTYEPFVPQGDAVGTRKQMAELFGK